MAPAFSKGGSSGETRRRFAEGKAAEIFSGKDITDADEMMDAAGEGNSAMKSKDYFQREAAKFATAAGAFIGEGGEFNNDGSKKLLKGTGNKDLLGGSANHSTDKLLHAATKAIKRGSLNPRDVVAMDWSKQGRDKVGGQSVAPEDWKMWRATYLSVDNGYIGAEVSTVGPEATLKDILTHDAAQTSGLDPLSDSYLQMDQSGNMDGLPNNKQQKDVWAEQFLDWFRARKEAS